MYWIDLFSGKYSTYKGCLFYVEKGVQPKSELRNFNWNWSLVGAFPNFDVETALWTF